MIELQPVTSNSRLREAFGAFPSGVTAVCALVDGMPHGMAASSFTSVSLSPPLVSLCIQRTSSTWPRLRDRPRLGLSVLAEGQDEAALRLSARTDDRFRDVPWDAGPGGSVFLSGSSAWLQCSVHEEVPAGDHLIALLEVHSLRTAPAPPLVFHGSRFRRLAAV
ncbi:flavin reductase family protein [Amycolatopsis panacis]|uniref:Flavin reductase n=1 Tax=Amycolatopsis panacis TaxID=2340917 RepID=A0A419I238_9PSEU|nr:flavin reductase family protein [Amycolatopsis panacis]RJQ83854.1 flavin reductase [Amycolatopsis panacis]